MSRDDTINMEHYEILSLAHKICNVCQKLSKRCPGGLCSNVVRKAKEIYYSQFAKDEKVRANGMREKQMIEEMAKIFCGMKNSCDECMWNKVHCNERNYAERAYNAGYRKQSEGEWKDKDRKGISILGYMVCSACDVMIPTCDNDRYCLSFLDYCPRCGARMKGGEE